MNHLNISGFPALDYACSEAMNTLCTNLSYCGTNVRTVLFTSRYEQEGKSCIAMNVMRTLASYGKRVLLVDADLRCSTLARRYRFDYVRKDAPGLAQYLAGMCALEQAIYETNLPGAFILPAGREVINSMQLLASPRCAEMMGALRERFDMVLVDSPPAGVIVDALEIAKHCDGTVFVVEYNVTRRRELLEAQRQMNQAGCPILGCIINKVSLDTYSAKKYYSKSYYSTHYEGDAAESSGGRKKRS